MFGFQTRCLFPSPTLPPSIPLVLHRKLVCARLLRCLGTVFRTLPAKGKKGQILKAMLFPVGWHHRSSFHQREQRANLTPAQTDVTLELWVSNERSITRWTPLWKRPNAPALGFPLRQMVSQSFASRCLDLGFFCLFPLSFVCRRYSNVQHMISIS